mmetsp:Transcript_3526/g.7789  ORF Transcript_3526/g.7789 Transcript_3526/m.7789 type:complete len:204 (+) Transcript_3526:103-714(+)|eukprot:CAMPEP_0172310216 /NCGR_PEP_ID=MMETSP1058-20130122/11358_1 /TAXON_ID=83371 /ORGANISM="Detonula confervacea, Strain CCMP 353" /LENGTH=203 /DNA_ID=CAMNT_0013022987 /DNA_START=86 /DNA_END=697 /DNA_ORIENTATION=+
MTNSNPTTKVSRWQHAILLIVCFLSTAHLPTLVLSESNDDEVNEADNALFNALKEEDIEAADAALKAGASINAISPRGMQTPLMQSVLHGRTKMVEWCLKNDADATIGERDGYTPMHGAGFQGRTDIAALLLKHGVGLRDVHKDGNEPAIRSCWGPEERHTDTVAWFLDNGVPLDDIYDTCMEATKNPRTKTMLEKRKGGDEL